jgi:hypothetical protein
VASISLIWTADPDTGHSCLKHALSGCQVGYVRSRILPFLALQTMADSEFPHGRRYYTKSGYFRYLDDSTIDRMIQAMATIPSSARIELAYLGGAAAQVSASETAFGDRSAPFIINLLASWTEASADVDNVLFIRQLFNQLQPAMKKGVHVNFMSGDEQDRVREAYNDRWDRMVEVKSQYDPKNFFRLNQNVPPPNFKRTAS